MRQKFFKALGTFVLVALTVLGPSEAYAQTLDVIVSVYDSGRSVGDVSYVSIEEDEAAGTPAEAYLTIAWRALADDGTTVLHADETLPATFRVTCVAGVGDGRLLVGGESWLTGASVIQLWELKGCTLLTVTGISPGTSGPTSGQMLLPRGLGRIAVIQESALATQQSPLWAFVLPHTSNRVVVGYRSGHVWELAIGPGADRLIASESGEQGSTVLPVGLTLVPMYGAHHVDHGRFFLLLPQRDDEQMLLFMDTDDDGLVDTSMTLDETSRSAMDLDNPAKHI